MRLNTALCGLCLSGLWAVSAFCAPSVAAQATAEKATVGSVAPTKAKGRVIAEYPKCKDPRHEKLRLALMKNKYLEGIAARINNYYAIPSDITLAVEELGQPNAFWNADKARISIGYELMDDVVAAFAQEGLGDSELIRKMFNVTEFVTFHELGHALVTELGLPITGREEDAVDQFSTYMLVLLSNHERTATKQSTSGGFAAADAAKYFALTSSSRISERSFWDSHSLNQQRFYDILTMVYGSGPKSYGYLVKTRMLPPERADSGPLEWLRVVTSWGRLTNPYMRK